MIDPRAPVPHPWATFCAHGGRVAAARAAFGGADWIDLSTGIAPWTWPVDTLAGLDRLPEPAEIAALEAAAARAFGVADPAQVVAVPGTDLAMRLLAPLIGARAPAVRHPGYAGHRAAWPEAELVAEGPGDHDLFVLASPANPDGRLADPVDLLAAPMTLVLDEAYADPAAELPACSVALSASLVLGSTAGEREVIVVEHREQRPQPFPARAGHGVGEQGFMVADGQQCMHQPAVAHVDLG